MPPSPSCRQDVFSRTDLPVMFFLENVWTRGGRRRVLRGYNLAVPCLRVVTALLSGPVLLLIGSAFESVFPDNLAISRPSTPVQDFLFANQPPRTLGTVPCGPCSWCAIRLKPGEGVSKPPTLFELGWPVQRVPSPLRRPP